MGLKNYPSLTFFLAQLVLDQEIQRNPSRRQIFAIADFQSKGKRRATQFGVGYTKYQPDIIFLNPSGEENILFANLLYSSSKALVWPN